MSSMSEIINDVQLPCYCETVDHRRTDALLKNYTGMHKLFLCVQSCNFHDELGNHLYPAEINCSHIKMIEAGDVTHINLKLYKWFPSLRYPINLFLINIQTTGYTI